MFPIHSAHNGLTNHPFKYWGKNYLPVSASNLDIVNKGPGNSDANSIQEKQQIYPNNFVTPIVTNVTPIITNVTQVVPVPNTGKELINDNIDKFVIPFVKNVTPNVSNVTPIVTNVTQIVPNTDKDQDHSYAKLGNLSDPKDTIIEKLQLNEHGPKDLHVQVKEETLNKKCKKQTIEKNVHSETNVNQKSDESSSASSLNLNQSEIIQNVEDIEKQPSSKKNVRRLEKQKNVTNVTENSKNNTQDVSIKTKTSEEWKCVRCDCAFKNKNKLIFHLKNLKENNSVRQCTVCQFKSCTKTGLFSHMDKNHTRIL